jgi:hypothetical protein
MESKWSKLGNHSKSRNKNSRKRATQNSGIFTKVEYSDIKEYLIIFSRNSIYLFENGRIEKVMSDKQAVSWWFISISKYLKI